MDPMGEFHLEREHGLMSQVYMYCITISFQSQQVESLLFSIRRLEAKCMIV